MATAATADVSPIATVAAPLDLSRVPHLEVRQRIRDLVEQRNAVLDQRFEAIKHLVAGVVKANETLEASIKPIYDAHEAAVGALDAEMDRLSEPFDKRLGDLAEQIDLTLDNADLELFHPARGAPVRGQRPAAAVGGQAVAAPRPRPCANGTFPPTQANPLDDNE